MSHTDPAPPLNLSRLTGVLLQRHHTPTLGLMYVAESWCVMRGALSVEGPHLVVEHLTGVPLTCTSLAKAVKRMYELAADEGRLIVGVWRELTDDEAGEVLEALGL